MNGLLRGGVFFAAYWYFWFKRGSDQNDRRRSIILILIATLLGLAVNRSIAFLLPFRARPVFNTALVHHALSIPMSTNLEHWSAFPSDTATYFVALAFGLAHLSRHLALPAVLYAGVWVCLPRMYLGLHYLSDIVVGALIGIAVVWVTLKTEWLRRSLGQRVLSLESRPQLFYACAFLLTFEMADVFDHIRDAVRGVLHVVRLGPHSHAILGALIFGAGVTIVVIAPWVALHVRHANRKTEAQDDAAAPFRTDLTPRTHRSG